jgi:hypothetical protein
MKITIYQSKLNQDLGFSIQEDSGKRLKNLNLKLKNIKG